MWSFYIKGFSYFKHTFIKEIVKILILVDNLWPYFTNPRRLVYVLTF